MKQIQKPLAFTFAELVVWLSILVILTTVAFLSFSGNISTSRDTKRQTDIASIESALKLYKQKRGTYPAPWSSFDITNSWTIVAKQWKLDQNVQLNTLDELPTDPKIKAPYTYSTTRNRQEFELAATLENDNTPHSILSWNYKSVSKNILPTITLAHEWSGIEIRDGIWAGSVNRTLFIFNNSFNNLPYTFEWNLAPYSKGIDFSTLLAHAENEWYWQNSDYRTCLEIYDAWKSIWDGEYQYSSWWTLQNTNCVMSSF